MKRAIILVITLLGACDALPRDPAGTSTRIERSRAFAVALADPSVRSAPELGRLIRESERRPSAHTQSRSGSGEALLQQLDDGTLDLVIGRFTVASP